MSDTKQKRNGKSDIEIYAIKFKTRQDDIDGFYAAAKLGTVRQREDGVTFIDTNQLKELKRLKIKIELLTPLVGTPKNHKIELRR
jgi:hypothetical protein